MKKSGGRSVERPSSYAFPRIFIRPPTFSGRLTRLGSGWKGGTVLLKAIAISRVPPDESTSPDSVSRRLMESITTRKARIGVIGLGYVGMPTALAFVAEGFETIGFDTNAAKVRAINEQSAGRDAVSKFRSTTDFADLRLCDCIMVSVPTPLSFSNEPDLSYLRAVAQAIKASLRRGQLIVLESTSYPGCTEELMLPILLEANLFLDDDFLLGFSPERIDPGNDAFPFRDVPRIVSGASDASRDAVAALYEQVVPSVYLAGSTRVAETAKLLENTFRAVNIGLVNELATMCHQMNIDLWDVIDAAKTKPFGFMPFYPGPGVGGHCIPMVPEFLSWKGRQVGVESRFISLAEQVNGSMPNFVVRLIAEALNDDGKPLHAARVLIVGASYKKDVGDAHESPAVEIIQILRSHGANVSYHDPFVPDLDFQQLVWKPGRPLGAQQTQHQNDPLHSVELSEDTLRAADCVVIVTDHSALDYTRMTREAKLIVDTRNALDNDARLHSRARVVRL